MSWQESAGTERRPEDWFHERATHYVEAQILHHLEQVGVFARLDRGPATLEELARELELDARILRCCVEYVEGVDDLLALDDSGRYSLTEFGAAVLDRYARDDEDGRSFNLFDVRVGSYGPVWSELTELLRGSKRYGRDVHRAGQHAAVGVYKVAPHLLPAFLEAAQGLGIQRVVEFGVPTGLLARAKGVAPGLTAIGVDRDRGALVDAERRARELGVDDIRFHRGDFFRPETWVDAVKGPGPAALATIHFHELVADGGERLQKTLRALAEHLPGWHVVAFEQERLPREARGEVSPTVWSYSHSNVLIHHLIDNGRILSRDGWVRLFEGGGCETVSVEPIGYLGYHLYVFRLPG